MEVLGSNQALAIIAFDSRLCMVLIAHIGRGADAVQM
jgi:hypothetical protein